MNLFKKVIIALRFTGLPNMLRSVRYSLFRDMLERRYPTRPKSGIPESPGHLQEAYPSKQGGIFRFASQSIHTELAVDYLASDLVRLSWSPGTPPVPYALAQENWPMVATTLNQEDSSWVLSSQDLKIVIQADGGLQFHSPDGCLLRSELPPTHQGEGTIIWKQKTRLAPDERIYGLGEQAGRLDLRGGTYRMWNKDPGGSYGPGTDPLYLAIPTYLGLHQQGSYLVFYENYHPATFYFPPVNGSNPSTGEPLAEARFEGGMLRYYFIPGPPARALERYTQLTGRAELPPLWSLGYHQSRWGYRSEGDIREVCAGFRKYELPISAIHLDIDYMEGYRVFTIDQDRFPDLTGLAREFRTEDIRLVAILDPGVKQDRDYFLYKQGIQQGVFCKQPDGKTLIGLAWPGWCAFPDFTSPKARAWWGSQYGALLSAGISGFWHDMNEPTSFTAWGNFTLPLPTHHDMDGQGGNHLLAHNLYGLLMNRAGYEGLKQLQPIRRPWIVSRSGWAGQQRYAWTWTGDTESSWKSLRMTIATVLGMGLSGLPFTGPDVGGFHGNPPAELYLRWFQMASFLPFFRTHSAVDTSRREPWVYGEPYTNILRSFLYLRYRLLPYLYTLAWEASQSGHPLVRPLFWIDGSDPALRDVDDAFLLGDDLLVAPVLEPGARARQVILPSGLWFNFWDDKPLHGPDNAILETDLEHIPMLVRAGSLLPMEEDGRLILHIYPLQASETARPGAQKRERKSTSHLYSDAGDGYGDWRLDRFSMQREGSNLILNWNIEGKYPFPYNSVDLRLHGLIARRALVDGKEVIIKQNQLEVPFFKHIQFEI